MGAMARICLLTLVALAAVLPASAQATFAGDNGAIAFAQRTTSGDQVDPTVEHTRIATRRATGTTTRTLVDCELTGGVPSAGNCTGTSYTSPSYSRDGSRIVFDAGDRIGVMDADGSGLSLLSAVTANDGDPVFAPDGRRIAFTGTNDRGTTDLYVRSLSGGAANLIVSDAGEPSWSSRGVIAYVRSGNVYVARPGGLHRRFVTSGVSPDWSPDGRRLILVRPLATLTFDAPIGRMYEVVARDGGGLRRIGPAADASDPKWSPQGNWIAYEVFESGVFAKKLGSTAAAREVALTQTSGESGSVASLDPAWRPLPR
jgi:dipeptidyl aminopeptidase/acylaminoacyl peptidase